jgi:multisubunit Na+/H+ antiporter MnhB subunit
MKYFTLSKWGAGVSALYLVLSSFAENNIENCGPWLEGCWGLVVMAINIPALWLVDSISFLSTDDHVRNVLSVIITAFWIYCLGFYIERSIRKKKNV